MKNKEAILENLNNRPQRYSYHESSRQTVARLLWVLSRANPLYDSEGNVKYTPTIRAYYLKYNREEYKKILRGMSLNRQKGFSKQNANGLIRLDDLKPPFLGNVKPDLNLCWEPVNK